MTAPRGYGIIKPIFDTKQKIIKCPGCLSNFELKGIGLWRCSANVKYQLFDETQPKTKSFTHIPEGSYIEFGDEITKVTDKDNNNSDKKSETNQDNQQNNINYQEMYKSLEFNVSV